MGRRPVAPMRHPQPVGHPSVRCQMTAASTGEQCRGRAYQRGWGKCSAHREAVRRYQHACPGCGVEKPRLVADCNACGGSYTVPKWPTVEDRDRLEPEWRAKEAERLSRIARRS